MAEADQKILDRIRKLLELSRNNPSEEDAALAAARAQELMLEYKIAFVQAEKQEGVERREIDNPFARHLWYQQLAVAVGDTTGCKVFLHNDQKRPGRKQVWFIGRSTDIAAAQVLLEWLRLELERIRDARGRLMTRHWKESYMVGAVTTVEETLRQRRKQMSVGSSIVKYDADVARLAFEWLRRNNIPVHQQQLQETKLDPQAFIAGRTDGIKIDPHAPDKRLK